PGDVFVRRGSRCLGRGTPICIGERLRRDPVFHLSEGGAETQDQFAGQRRVAGYALQGRRRAQPVTVLHMAEQDRRGADLAQTADAAAPENFDCSFGHSVPRLGFIIYGYTYLQRSVRTSVCTDRSYEDMREQLVKYDLVIVKRSDVFLSDARG